jgi:DNA invertase Pin-like site-specific DNA recombinase
LTLAQSAFVLESRAVRSRDVVYSRRDPHHVQRRVIHHEIASVSFKAVDDPSIDTRSCTGKLVMGIRALIAEFENDIRRGARRTDR